MGGGLSIPDKLDECHVVRSAGGSCCVSCGFELASYATPAQHDTSNSKGASQNPERNPVGADSIYGEVYGALLPLLESLPDGASLVIEYHISHLNEGSADIRIFVLVRAPASHETEAIAQSQRLRQELALALSVLSDLYSFKVARFEQRGDSLPTEHSVYVKPGAREVGGHNPAGFVQGGATNHQEVLIPAIAPTMKGRPSLLFSAEWPATAGKFLSAACTLAQPVRVTIRLTRESISAELRELLTKAKMGHVGKVHEERNADVRTPAKYSWDQELELAGDNFLDDLSAQSLALRMNVEAASDREIPEAFLRLVGLEMFPGAPARIVRVAEEKAEAGVKKVVTDLSDMLPYPHWIPPLLPSPSMLEKLLFNKHYSNPLVRLPEQGLELGRVQSGGFEHPVFIAPADRSRHMYLLGATGTGKSTLIYNMVRQDMEAGYGVAVMDPHGDLFEQVLNAVPQNRIEDVVIIDPSDKEHPVGLNPMDLPEDVSPFVLNRVLNNLLDIFDKLYDMRRTGGPMFELYFRNSFKLVVGAPREIYAKHPLSFESIARILRDRQLMEKALDNFSVDDPVFTFFAQAMKTSGDQSFENFVPYITSKLNRLVDNPLLHSMVCASRRTIDFRKVMDERKILLVNLAKGDIGGQDARLLGMLITNYVFEAALGRTDAPKDARTPFYYYLDEFQNFTTDTIADILAEARKYGLHLVLANQTLSQLINPGLPHPRALLEAVLGNVATKLCMRVGMDDAQHLEPHFLPRFNARILSQLPDRHVASRLLVDGHPSESFVFSTLPAMSLAEGGGDARQRVLDLSRRKYSVS